MRYLIASDIHGRVNATKKFLALVERYKPEKILLLGDFLYNGPRNGVPSDYDGMAVANMLVPYKDKILGVRGNCDAQIDLDVLSFPLEMRREITLNGHHFIMVHGDNLKPDFVKAAPHDIVMYGHIHLPVLETKGEVTYLNPGSISFPKGGNPASFALLDENTLSILELDSLREMKKLDLAR
jgi:uncharacterized protein